MSDQDPGGPIANLKGEGHGHGLMTPMVPSEYVGRHLADVDGRRRVHPLTPLIHGLRIIPIVLLIGFSTANSFAKTGDARFLAGVLVVAVVLIAPITGLQYIAWKRLSYFFDSAGDLRIDSGVLQRHERRIQLSRLQAIDVVQPLAARLVGMAEVRIEVAGSASKATLQFLTVGEATALRSEILARAAGVRHDAGEAPENVLVHVPAGDLVLSLALQAHVWFFLVVTVLLVVVTVLSSGPAGLTLLVVAGGAPIFIVFSEFSKFFGFTLAESPDGLRLRHGLLQTAAQTVPPGRVQAVGFYEPLLWRRRGWVRVKINVAGVKSSDQGSGDRAYSESVLLPVAPWPVAIAVVSRILPGVNLQALEWQSAPRRARWRSPWQWRCLAVAVNDSVFAVRGGWLERRTCLVPHARTQSLRVTQGPYQRALGLASVHVDSTPGPVGITGHCRDANDARELAEAQSDRARLARGAAPPARWLR